MARALLSSSKMWDQLARQPAPSQTLDEPAQDPEVQQVGFRTAGDLPAVAADSAATTAPSASEQAYGGGPDGSLQFEEVSQPPVAHAAAARHSTVSVANINPNRDRNPHAIWRREGTYLRQMLPVLRARKPAVMLLTEVPHKFAIDLAHALHYSLVFNGRGHKFGKHGAFGPYGDAILVLGAGHHFTGVHRSDHAHFGSMIADVIYGGQALHLGVSHLASSHDPAFGHHSARGWTRNAKEDRRWKAERAAEVNDTHRLLSRWHGGREIFGGDLNEGRAGDRVHGIDRSAQLDHELGSQRGNQTDTMWTFADGEIADTGYHGPRGEEWNTEHPLPQFENVHF